MARPRNVFAIGLNYSDHAKETGAEIPSEPILFMKATSAVCGPNDPILIPRGSEKTDWEVELGLVIGRDCRYLDSPAAARDVVAGFCVANDVSERAFQIEHGGQWSKGKSSENFLPLGPWLVTVDEVPDPQRLGLTLDVNGTRLKKGTQLFSKSTGGSPARNGGRRQDNHGGETAMSEHHSRLLTRMA